MNGRGEPGPGVAFKKTGPGTCIHSSFMTDSNEAEMKILLIRSDAVVIVFINTNGFEPENEGKGDCGEAVSRTSHTKSKQTNNEILSNSEKI